MGKYRYCLDKSSKKHNCPQCNEKRYVRYIDRLTNMYLPIQYGRCDRVNNCNYHQNPYTDKNDKKISFKPFKHIKSQPIPVHFNPQALIDTLDNYENNTFIQNLLHSIPFPFNVDDVIKVIEQYRLGTVGTAIAFPFINEDNNIRAIQVKNFDKNNNTTNTTFLHSILKKRQTSPKWLDEYIDYGKENKFVDCLFGAHLLKKYPNNPVALVEAPKTAIYGNLYFGLPYTPDKHLWLAVYSRDTFTFDKVKALSGRKVIVFPDLSKDGSTFNLWKRKAEEFERALPGTNFIVSDFLEKTASDEDKKNGNDLADYLVRFNWNEYRNQK